MYKKDDRVTVVRVVGDISDFEHEGVAPDDLMGTKGVIVDVVSPKIATKPIGVKLDKTGKTLNFSSDELEHDYELKIFKKHTTIEALYELCESKKIKMHNARIEMDKVRGDIEKIESVIKMMEG